MVSVKKPFPPHTMHETSPSPLHCSQSGSPALENNACKSGSTRSDASSLSPSFFDSSSFTFSLPPASHKIGGVRCRREIAVRGRNRVLTHEPPLESVVNELSSAGGVAANALVMAKTTTRSALGNAIECAQH